MPELKDKLQDQPLSEPNTGSGKTPWLTLRSDFLTGMLWDQGRSTLYLRMKTGTYNYHVDYDIANGLYNASSPGRYYNRFIKQHDPSIDRDPFIIQTPIDIAFRDIQERIQDVIPDIEKVQEVVAPFQTSLFLAKLGLLAFSPAAPILAYINIASFTLLPVTIASISTQAYGLGVGLSNTINEITKVEILRFSNEKPNKKKK